jgi:hypothetical protein
VPLRATAGAGQRPNSEGGARRRYAGGAPTAASSSSSGRGTLARSSASTRSGA